MPEEAKQTQEVTNTPETPDAKETPDGDEPSFAETMTADGTPGGDDKTGDETPDPVAPVEGKQPDGETDDVLAALTPFQRQIAKRAKVESWVLQAMGDRAGQYLETVEKPKLDAWATHFAELGRRQTEADKGSSPATPTPTTPKTTPKAEPPPAPAAEPDDDFSLDLSAFEDDPASLGVLKKLEGAVKEVRAGRKAMQAEVDRRVEERMATYAPYIQQQQREQQRQVKETVDGFFKELESDFGTEVGVGSMDAIDPKSDFGKTRQAVIDKAGAILRSEVAVGNAPNLRDALELAWLTHHKPTPKPEREASQKMREQRRASITPAPSRRVDRNLPQGEEAAKEALGKKLAAIQRRLGAA